LQPLSRYLIERAINSTPQNEADWASYMLFDGGFASEMMGVGYKDALARRDEILKFFGKGDQR